MNIGDLLDEIISHFPEESDLEPENKAFEALAELDGRGYFATGEDCTTKTAGVFVAGDCRQKGVRQVSTATADGAVAAIAACRYIDGM